MDGSSRAEIYTHGHHESVLQAHASRNAQECAAYLLPHLTAGVQVLDVGCGPGSISCDFALLVAPSMVTGVDASAEVLERARDLAGSRGVPNVRFQTGNVYALDFPADHFDVVHAHQMLQHLSDPVAALREMRRVARPGGLVAARDADFHGMFWYPQTPELDEWMEMYQSVARHNRAEPDAGRRLVAWAQEAGFTDVAPSSSNWIYATAQQRRWLARVWAQRVLHSSLAEQALSYGYGTEAGLQRIAAGWHRWGESADGVLVIPNGEVLLRA